MHSALPISIAKCDSGEDMMGSHERGRVAVNFFDVFGVSLLAGAGVPSEFPLPFLVSDDHDRRRAGTFVFFDHRPPEHRRQASEAEAGGRQRGDAHFLRAAVRRDQVAAIVVERADGLDRFQLVPPLNEIVRRDGGPVSGIGTGHHSVTALFCLQMSFTAYAQLLLPQVAQAFTNLGFPDYFRVELSLAKIVGVVLLLAPVPPRLKEWAYAGFAIDLGSAIIAHLAVGHGPEAWGWAVGTGVLWALSYFCWRRMRPHCTAFRIST